MRLAHFSDVHVTASPLSVLSRDLGGVEAKHLAGALNHYLGGRARHFRGAEERLERLLGDVDRVGADHALFTGDVTAMSLPEEFERCASVFGPRLARPDRFTAIAGNHDRYAPRATEEGRFERWFGRLAGAESRVPFTKSIGEAVTLVAADACRPTSLFDSSGLLGGAQIDALRQILTDPSLRGRFVVLALHYALLRRDGRPDRRIHGLRDLDALLGLIDSEDVHLDLVLHGHIHRAYEVRTRRRVVRCAGSATDLFTSDCGYDLYTIDPDRRTFSVTRRFWDRRRGAFDLPP